MIIERKDNEILERRDCPNVQHPSWAGMVHLGGVGLPTMPGLHGSGTRGRGGYGVLCSLWGYVVSSGGRSTYSNWGS